MPRRIKSKPKKRDWRWYASFALNAAVALSMVLGTVIIFTGGPAAPAQPTISVPTESPGSNVPTATPTPLARPYDPTSYSAGVITFAVAGYSRDGDVI